MKTFHSGDSASIGEATSLTLVEEMALLHHLAPSKTQRKTDYSQNCILIFII